MLGRNALTWWNTYDPAHVPDPMTGAPTKSYITASNGDYASGDLAALSLALQAEIDDPDLEAAYKWVRGAVQPISPPGNWFNRAFAATP